MEKWLIHICVEKYKKMHVDTKIMHLTLFFKIKYFFLLQLMETRDNKKPVEITMESCSSDELCIYWLDCKWSLEMFRYREKFIDFGGYFL